jgi:hypothetical protein
MGDKCQYLTPACVRCKSPLYRRFRVRVRHYKTGRRTWQTWRLCKAHYILFLETAETGHWENLDRKGQPLAAVINWEKN